MEQLRVEQLRYWVVIEREDYSLRGSHIKKIGPFTNRDRAEEVLAKSIGTIAIGGVIEEEREKESVSIMSGYSEAKGESPLKSIQMESIREQILAELAHTMKDEDARKERTNNIMAAMGDEQFGVDMVYEMLTPTEAHGGIDDQMERDRSSYQIARICNPGVTNEQTK